MRHLDHITTRTVQYCHREFNKPADLLANMNIEGFLQAMESIAPGAAAAAPYHSRPERASYLTPI